jgi:hypothetical protein
MTIGVNPLWGPNMLKKLCISRDTGVFPQVELLEANLLVRLF